MPEHPRMDSDIHAPTDGEESPVTSPSEGPTPDTDRELASREVSFEERATPSGSANREASPTKGGFTSSDERITQPAGHSAWTNTTLRSADRPHGPPPSGWDERRVEALEKETDQLRAVRTLLIKRLDRLEVGLRVTLVVALCALTAAVAATCM